MTDTLSFLADTLRDTPELQTAPGLAYAAVQGGGDPVANGQALAYSANTAALDRAYSHHARRHVGLLGRTLGTLGGAFGHVAGMAGHELNAAFHLVGAPLREVQHQYRYLHDVESRHGPFAAALEGLGLAAGAVAGAFVAGPQGAVLGAELAAELEGHLSYTDSWKRTSSGEKYRDQTTHQQVSIGRDVAHLFHLKHGAPYTIVSGGVDAIADLQLDPLGQLGKLEKAAHRGAGLGGMLAERYPGVTVKVAEDINRALEAGGNAPLRRAFQTIAGMSAEELVSSPFARKYGALIGENAPAGGLGAADTVDKVADVFKTVLRADELAPKELARYPGQLPTLSFTRKGLMGTGAAVREFGTTGTVAEQGFARRAVRRATTFLPTSIDAEKLALTGKTINPTDDFGAKALHDALLFGESGHVAREVTARYLAASDPADRIVIAKNAIIDSLMAAGLGEDSQIVRRFSNRLDELAGNYRDNVYAVDANGRIVSNVVQNGKTIAAGVADNHIGRIALPDYNEVKTALRSMNNVGKWYGAVDDMAYRYFTQGVFKKLVLLTGGFAIRISAAEQIPNALRQGFINNVRSAVATNAERLNFKADEEELGHIGAAVAKVLNFSNRKLNDEKLVRNAVTFVQSTEGHLTEPALNAGHVGHESMDHRAHTLIEKLSLDLAPRKVVPGPDFGLFGPEDEHYVFHRHADLVEKAHDPKYREAAKAFDAALERGASMEEATRAGSEAATDWLRNQPPEYHAKYVRSRLSDSGGDPLTEWGQVVMEDLRNSVSAPPTTPGDVMTAVPDRDLLGLVGKGRPLEVGRKAFVAGRIDAGTVEAVDPVAQTVTVRFPGEKSPRTLPSDVVRSADTATSKAIKSHIAVKGRDGTWSMRRSLDEQPIKIKGREFVPDQDRAIDRIANWGHDKFLSPIINVFGRSGTVFTEWNQQYEGLAHLVEQGVLTEADAANIAHIRTIQNVAPFIHNITERSQFAENARNFMPFFFAQQQAYARFGRLLADDPGAFRREQLMITSFLNLAHEEEDENGEKSLVFPGTGWITKGTVGALSLLGIPVAGSVPVGFSGNVQSFKTVLPFVEVGEGQPLNFGPLVAVPLKAVSNLFPEAQPLTTALAGPQASSTSIWDQLIPNTFLKNSIKAMGSEHSRSFQSAMVQTIQALAARQQAAVDEWEKNGEKGPRPAIVPGADAGPMAQQEFIDRVKNQTRINFMARAVLGLVSPAAPKLDIGDMKLREEFRDLVRKQGMAKAFDTFLAEHPDATPYTIFQSESPTGAPIPASEAAADFFNEHRAVMDKYPMAGAWLLPQNKDQKFDAAVYNEQLAQGLRRRKTPEQVLKDIYTAAGNEKYYADKKIYEAALAEVDHDPPAKRALQAQWREYQQTFQLQNPVWADYITSGERENQRAQALAELQQMFDKGDAPKTEHVNDIRELLADYQTYQDNRMVGRTDTFAVAQRKALEGEWLGYLEQLKKEKPNLSAIINKLWPAVLREEDQ